MKNLLLLPVLLSLGFAGEISFNKDIRPLLADRCFNCHGPDSATRKAGLRLDMEDDAKRENDSSGLIAINPGKPDESSILTRITHADPDEVMPPPKSKITVSDSEVALLRQWIEEGAKWERHWSFIPPAKAEGEGSIDTFIHATLEDEKLKPSPSADPATLLRRLSFDLTGLPPTIAELDDFIAAHKASPEKAEAATAAAVDRLLASPAFGERMALDWLDVARYGDTDGLFTDHARSVYPWRDWVVDAFNENLPHDDFITWQVAGDLLPEATPEQKIATGFLRHNLTSNEGGIIQEDYRIKYTVDRVNVTATAFLGLTLECAQCHDHKFDPMTQKEYFEFSGFFNSMVGNGNTKGTAAPFLTIHTPEDEKRLGEITSALEELDARLKENPPELLADFKTWEKEGEKPVAWHPVDTGDSDADTDAEPVAETPISPVVGRFVRFAHKPNLNGWMTLAEVQVFSDGQNIALGGKPSQSSTGYNAPADRAIDGNPSGSFTTCSCTNKEEAPWWEIDLGAEIPIDHIVAYNRSDCCPERLDNVTVSILAADRNEVETYNTGDAPFRSVFTANPKAPPPPEKAREDTLLFTAEGELAALQFASETPGQISGITIDRFDGEQATTVVTVENPKLKIGADSPAVVVFKEPFTLGTNEQLRVILKGVAARKLAVGVTADSAAASRATLPDDPKERLAFFRNTWPGFAEERARKDRLDKENAGIKKRAQQTMIAADMGKMRPTFILERGEYDKRGEEVQPAALSSIMPYDERLPATRVGLAKWLVDEKNPLTARVAVNRFWQTLFGRGLVKTSEDFGTQGDRPSHPELLDTLAVEFVDSGWDVKALVRRIVLSETYRQSSQQSPDLRERDPENRLLARGVRQRLPAEFIRDHALATSGLLVDKRGGPGVNPYQPAALFGRNAIGAPGAKFVQSKGVDLYRRSLYTYWKRQIPAANMRILGADGRTACRTRREMTNTPLQALVLLNDPQFIETARVLAERAMKEGGDSTESRLGYAFRLATSRVASPFELEVLVAEHADRLSEFKADPESAKAYLNGGGEKKPDANLDAVALAATAAVSSLILNLDESMSKN